VVPWTAPIWEIVKERLEREFELSLISTAPTVIYKVEKTKKGIEISVDNPAVFRPVFES